MALSKPAALTLSLRDKLDFFPALASICLAAFYSILTGFWRGERQAQSFFLHIGYAIFRKATVRLSPLQMQYVAQPTLVPGNP
jgi:membrane protein DedA with SNARE-associated domain